MFNFIKRFLMSAVTQPIIDAINKLKSDADTLSPAEIEQIQPIIAAQVEAAVAAATAELTEKVNNSAEILSAIEGALVDSGTTATETTEIIGAALGVTPVNAEPTDSAEPSPAA